MPTSPPPASPAWGTDRLDLGAYLARVGADAPAIVSSRDPGPDVLASLHRAHATALPFDNIDMVLHRTAGLAVPEIVDKMCRRSRGGCCHEHNLLFGSVLERLGYHVRRLAARVMLGGHGARPRTHMALRVTSGDRDWLCDVGFGEEGFLDPVPLRPGDVLRQGDRAFRVVPCRDHQYGVEIDRHGRWERMYLLSLEPRPPIDFTVAHHYLSTHPRSMLRRELYLQRLTPTTRLTLRGRTLTRVHAGGVDRTRIGPADLPRTLDEFGIVLPGRDLAVLLRRWEDGGAGAPSSA
ncbi:arylamine N-acetyltransferase family protein [Actinomadura flavalba]|uniref:arylamine N-acetyltransferase family protein n=1 Tax=Actinomadura flavalba TaxID=1120938 RepID=UPI000370A27D|nr:arylamine N-acetyltransferase [Actinomadura flavalba]